MVKTEEEAEAGPCKLYVKPQHLFAFDESGERIPMTDDILAAIAKA